jgi:hypothetical protein
MARVTIEGKGNDARAVYHPTRQDKYQAQVAALGVYIEAGYEGLKKRYGEAKALTHYMAACRAVKRLQESRARRKLASAGQLREVLVSAP